MRMSIAQEMIARRDGRIYCVETQNNPANFVRLCPWKAKEWFLPWSRLEGMHYDTAAEIERIELQFPFHRVIILGRNLKSATESICEGDVRCMRDLPECHFAAFEPKEPFITQLEVRLVGGAMIPHQENLPF